MRSLPNSWVCLYPQDNTATSKAVTLSPDNRGLAYADGFFTTMGVMDGLILWADYHYQRLISHADALQLDMDCEELLAVLKIYAQQLEQGMLKLVVTRAAQDIRGYGYAPSESGSDCEIWLKPAVMRVSTAVVLSLPDGNLVPMQPNASAICLSSQIACLPPSLAGLKSLSRLDNVLASGELQRIKAEPLAANVTKSLSEGLLRDMSGHWVEGTMSNVFYQLADEPLCESETHSSGHEDVDNNHENYLTTGQWYTPSMDQSGVAGVMRQVIIDALSTTEYPVVIRSLSDEDLPRLTRLFFCNALRGIMPMTSLTLLSGDIVDFKSA
ncbi:aminotransferase class IV [Psychrobacter pocilloporae]|uniref:Aminodeoxychorismate lyase n=1 Tax=Psychrobacter pocilloporae TaxID=1775882 RepID=A0ABT6IPP2_9GAMM|nr:aminotransferase class IV [Psychrobacter pocilloporae]MDH4903794.1 aminodeoxychorismate lyase [Psychrobacter pocilloporae]